MKKGTGITGILRNRRGVALLIVLLVTSLLIALIFEFSYATRISLNSAINFRDSQQAYYLARAGVGAFTKYGEQLRKIIPAGEFQPVPGIEEQIMLKWEDQRALINVNTSPPEWMENLFRNIGIGTDVLERIRELKTRRNGFRFLSELHAVMPDEDYAKVVQFLTVDGDGKVNLNTASVEVLNSIFPDKPQLVSTIINTRKDKMINGWQDVPGLDTNTVGATVNSLVGNSEYFRVYSYATVGGYTKQVEAVFQGGSPSFMKAL